MPLYKLKMFFYADGRLDLSVKKYFLHYEHDIKESTVYMYPSNINNMSTFNIHEYFEICFWSHVA